MRAFVTGGSGFVGTHLIGRLVSEGTDVVALARSEDAAEAVRASGAQPVAGSLSSTGAMTESMKGCDVIFHAAAWVGAWGDPNEIWATNVEGTANVISAAKAAGVPSLVHVSTESVLLDGRHLEGVDETEPIPSGGHLSAYARTKAKAETMVISANGPQLRTVAIRPRFIWGPGDPVLLPTITKKVEMGAFAWADKGQHLQSTCHVQNAVEALILAVTRGGGGEAYFVTDGPPVTFREFVTAYLGTVGVDPGERSVPGWLLRAVGATMEWGWKTMRLESAPPITRVEASMSSLPMTVDDSKARRQLHYREQITFEEGMAELRTR